MSIAPGGTVAILLAAGRSKRFGPADKLTAPLAGRALSAHAAQALAAIPFRARLAVISPSATAPAGFEAVLNPEPERGLSRSLALGVAAARALGAEAVLVALADMPLVPPEHFVALLERFDPAETRIATSSPGGRAMVPAAFGARWYAALMALDGDRGAQPLLAGAPMVALDPAHLLDVDRAEDLAAAAHRLGGGA